MKSMYKHWGLHISTNINCLSAVLGAFWVVWKGLLWCLKAKHISWQFPRYWRFNKWYYSSYQLICLISWPLLIASRHDWYWSKGLFKGFWVPLRPWESSKNWWRYGWMKFVTGYTLLTHDYMSFWNVLWSHDPVTWYDYLSYHIIYILTLLYDLILGLRPFLNPLLILCY